MSAAELHLLAPPAGLMTEGLRGSSAVEAVRALEALPPWIDDQPELAVTTILSR